MAQFLSIPAPPGLTEPPVWTGSGFLLGGKLQPVVSYEVGASGWSEELTAVHEDIGDEDHYMNVASREHAISRLERWVRVPQPLILDIGCSSGYTIRAIRKRLPAATVAGADYVREPLERLSATMPDVPLLQFDLADCPLPDKSIDAAVLLNVLEHIEDDGAAMRHVHRILRPGGIAVIELPAGPHLFDIYDQQLMHHRRYRMDELVERLRSHGFRVLERSHLGFLLYPGFWAVKKRNQRYLRADPESQRKIVVGHMRHARSSALMQLLMRIEASLRDRMYLPFGIRCLVVCERTA
jgi:SAM-dependent methyltransferase